MGEIKSTLDLVMARTRHLTMTEEEKKEQQIEKVKQQLQGLIQKYRDRAINLQQLQDAVEKLRNTEEETIECLLTETAVEHIELAGDNTALLAIIETVCKADIAEIKKQLLEFQMAADRLRQTREEALLDRLSDTYRISGTAVIPNLAKDDVWKTEHHRLLETHQTKLYKLEIGLQGKMIR